MIAVLYDTQNKVVSVLEGVTRFENGEIDAKEGGARGIGHNVLIVDDAVSVKEGDTINPATLTDKRAQLPKTKDQIITDLKAQIAANADAINFLLGV